MASVRLRLVAGIFALVVGGDAAVAGPFGVNMGDPITKFRVEKSDLPNIWRTETLPNAHPQGDFYYLLATKADGVCRVSVAMKNNEDDAYGNAVRTQYERIVAAITSKYGTPESSFDDLRSGSIWKEARYFSMSLAKKERSLATYWINLDNADHVKNIGVEVKALDSDTTYVAVRYEFSNIQKCLSDLERDLDGSL